MTERLDARSARIERSLERTLSSPHADVEFDSIRDRWPAEYVRGQLFLALVDAVGTEVADPYPAAVSLELSYLQARSFERLGRLDAPAPLVARCFSVLSRASVRIHEGQYEQRQFSGDETTGDGGVIRFDRTAPAVLGGAAMQLAGVLGAVDGALLSRLEESGAAFGWTLATEVISGDAAVAHPLKSLDGVISEIVACCPELSSPGLRKDKANASRFTAGMKPTWQCTPQVILPACNPNRYFLSIYDSIV